VPELCFRPVLRRAQGPFRAARYRTAKPT